MSIRIGRVRISRNHVTIIAEAGVNHNGKLSEAIKLAKAAKNSGAHIIKFQTYKSKLLTSTKAKKFWKKKSDKSKFQDETYKKLDSFSFSDYIKLKQYCDKIKIEFISTPFDSDSLKMLLKLNVKAIKIASCDINNFPFIREICATRLPIFLSTGASTIFEIKKAVQFIKKQGNKLILLHCILSYPTKMQDLNLNIINTLQRKFPDIIIGFSDHAFGPLSSILSVVSGARVIEKHFTLKKNHKKIGDHWFAADPREMQDVTRQSKLAIAALGQFERKVFPCEKLARLQARRSIFLNQTQSKNYVLTDADFICKRPGTGLPPSMITKLIKKKLRKKVCHTQLLKLSDLY